MSAGPTRLPTSLLGLSAATLETTTPLADLAHELAIAILIVHHTRKAPKEGISDPPEEISGSTGLTGAVDGALILTRRRHTPDGKLELIRRDLPDALLALQPDDTTGMWHLLPDQQFDEADPLDAGPHLTSDQARYVELLRQRGPMRPQEIAVALGESARRKCQVEYLTLLEHLDRGIPASVTTIHLLADNVSVHHGKLVQQWFGILRRKRLRTPNFADLASLQQAIHQFIAQWHEIAHPFRWTSHFFDKILAKIEATLAPLPATLADAA